MGGKREKLEDIVLKMRQFEVLQGQGNYDFGEFEAYISHKAE